MNKPTTSYCYGFIQEVNNYPYLYSLSQACSPKICDCTFFNMFTG